MLKTKKRKFAIEFTLGRWKQTQTTSQDYLDLAIKKAKELAKPIIFADQSNQLKIVVWDMKHHEKWIV
jgi:hypothetical protein